MGGVVIHSICEDGILFELSGPLDIPASCGTFEEVLQEYECEPFGFGCTRKIFLPTQVTADETGSVFGHFLIDILVSPLGGFALIAHGAHTLTVTRIIPIVGPASTITIVRKHKWVWAYRLHGGKRKLDTCDELPFCRHSDVARLRLEKLGEIHLACGVHLPED